MTFCRRGTPIKVKLRVAAARPPVVPSVEQPSGGSAGPHGHGNVRNVAVSSFAGKQKELLKLVPPHTTRLPLSITVCIVLIQSARPRHRRFQTSVRACLTNATEQDQNIV